MTSEDFALIALAETTKEYVRPIIEDCDAEFCDHKKRKHDERAKKRSLFFRLPSFRLRTNFSSFRRNVRKVSCLRGEEDEIPMMEIPRHKSIDIGVGLARKMSLFLFTRKSVCIHPYHPFTPKQTTRKIYLPHDEWNDLIWKLDLSYFL